MSLKNANESTALLFDSKVKGSINTPYLSPNKFTKIPNSPLKDTGASTPLQRKCSQYKLSQQSSQSEGKHSNSSLPVLLAKIHSSEELSSHARTQISRLREEKEILQRNVQYQIEFYIRERMKDLVTIQELLLANQYQRVQKYVETQLSLLKKRCQNILSQDTFCKPTLTKDTSIRSNIQEDLIYNELINNLTDNLRQFELSSHFILPIVKNLVNETELSVKKLSWYFQQVPFEAPKYASKNLATKMICQLGCNDGRKVLEMISKSVQQNTKGKFILNYQQQLQKSEMSKLIEQHSMSKIKSNKKLREQLSL